MSFRITGLPSETFVPLFSQSEAELKEHGAVRKIASGGEPCRVSLTDAVKGEEVILVNYEHHDVASPYRMRYAVFVRPGEIQFDAVNTIPGQLRSRMLAVRSFDADGMNLGHRLTPGSELESDISDLFVDPEAQYIHIHYASAGCFAARVERA